MKPYEQCTAHKDEDEAHDNGTNNSPKQDVFLVFFFHAKRTEDEHHYKQVVDTEAIFNKVSGDILGNHFDCKIVRGGLGIIEEGETCLVFFLVLGVIKIGIEPMKVVVKIIDDH